MKGQPILSAHFARRTPSSIRLAQIEFARRKDAVKVVNVAIGNVSLPMHPAMIRRMAALAGEGSPFREGVVRYTPTVGLEETRAAFLNIIASSGFDTEGLQVLVTDGGSAAMELAILGVCGPAGTGERPLLAIDPVYTNYLAFAERLGRGVVSMTRTLNRDGSFSLPDRDQIERLIRETRPGALLVIPYDNPTGQLYDLELFASLARQCVEHNLWLVSDEAYRELNYTGRPTPSLWALTEAQVPGVCGRRISIESASKVWNACGLRIGALVTDNEEFHRRAVAEATANLCANAIGQHIFAALAGESREELRRWYRKQADYYRSLLADMTGELLRLLPGLIVSSPSAAIYSVVDVREIVKPGFSAVEFVMFCAREGAVSLEGERTTLLVAPMSGFYQVPPGQHDPGATQMRIAYVGSPEDLRQVPRLFKELLGAFERLRS